MPFESEAQRRWMHANEPEMARRWEKHTPNGKKLPARVGKLTIGADTLVGKMRESPLPLMPPIGGASGPADRTPEMPDFESIYAGPEAKRRQQQEAEQSEDRRRSVWRDYSFGGLHGAGAPSSPLLRYVEEEGDIASEPRHYLTAEQLRQHQKRVQTGAVIGYEVVQGETKRRKKG